MAELNVERFRDRLGKIHSHFVKHRYVTLHCVTLRYITLHYILRVVVQYSAIYHGYTVWCIRGAGLRRGLKSTWNERLQSDLNDTVCIIQYSTRTVLLYHVLHHLITVTLLVLVAMLL
jgi:hypothetical protein